MLFEQLLDEKNSFLNLSEEIAMSYICSYCGHYTRHHQPQVVRAQPHHYAVISTWKKIKVGISVNFVDIRQHQLLLVHVRMVLTRSMSILLRKVADMPASFAVTRHHQHQVVLVHKAHKKSMNICST